MSREYRFDRTRRIVEDGVIAIVRAAGAEEAERLGETLLEGGVGVLEVSLTTPGATTAIERLASRHPRALIGAGTVLDAPSAAAATLAGAAFLVSPSLAPEVIRSGHRYGAPVLAGVLTPSEIEAALASGADLLKLFPAGALTPGYLREVRAPFPQAPIVPTGGIDSTNAAAWLEAGAVALGVGGALADDPAELTKLRAALAAYRDNPNPR